MPGERGDLPNPESLIANNYIVTAIVENHRTARNRYQFQIESLNNFTTTGISGLSFNAGLGNVIRTFNALSSESKTCERKSILPLKNSAG